MTPPPLVRIATAAAADPDGRGRAAVHPAGRAARLAPPSRRRRRRARSQSAQSAKGDLRTLFSADDYPASAQSAGAEGTAQRTLTIGPDGRVTAATSSARPERRRSIRRRATFFAAARSSLPAADSNGNATTDTITTPPIVWRLGRLNQTLGF